MAQTFNTILSFAKSTSRKDRRKGVGSLSVSAVAGGGVGSAADSATQAWVRDNFVDKTTEQEISALKIFSQGIKIGDVSLFKHPDGYVYLDETLVLKGGAVMYGNSSGVDVPSIFDSLPIDGETIKRDGNGALYVDEKALSISGGGGGGGVADSVYWNNVIGKPSWIGSTKPTYKYSEIEERPDLSVYAKLTDIPSLDGYATQSWVENKGYLLAATASNTYQPKITTTNKLAYSLISGTPTIPTKLSQLTDDVVAGKYLPITGGTINGTNYNPLSIASNDNSLTQVYLYTKDTLRGIVQYNVNFGVGFHNPEKGGIYVKDDGTPIFLDSSDTPKTLFHAGNYADYALPLTGGTMNSTSYIAWNNGADGNDVSDWNTITENGLRIISSISTTSNAPTQYSTALHIKGRYGFQIASAGSDGVFYIRNISPKYNSWYSIIHSGNIGTQSVARATNADNLADLGSHRYYHSYRFITNTDDLAKLNIGSYAISGEKGGASPAPTPYSSLSIFGDIYYSAQLCVKNDASSAYLRGITKGTATNVSEWHQIAFTDSNVASATKLATARTIWGQSFDGTKDVTGAITVDGDASFSSKVVIGTIPVYQSADGTLFVDANVVFRGGVAMYGDATTTINEE